jgi:hypothetical protein
MLFQFGNWGRACPSVSELMIKVNNLNVTEIGILRIHATSPFHSNLCPQCFEFFIKLILHFSGTGEGKREREMGSVRGKREEGIKGGKRETRTQCS